MQILIDIRSIIATLAVIAGAALSSCSDSASGPDVPDTPETTAQYILGLYVQTGDNAGSRAPSGDYDPGMGYENYIDVAGKDFKVAIFTADAANTADDGTLICEATDVKVTPQESGIGSKRWLLEFQIPATAHDAIDGHSIKVVMLANWRGKYPELTAGSTKLSELFSNSSAMDYSAGLPGAVLTADDKIAMFGVCQYDNVQLVANWSTILDERLHLLRALAKIEVWDSPESSAKISSVSLTRYMDKAMPLPAGVTHQNDYVKNDYDKDYGPGPSLPANAVSSGPVSLTQAEDGHYIIYVPEYQNFNNAGVFAEDVRSRLELTYGDGTKHYVEFAYYKNPTDPTLDGPQSIIDTSKGKNGYFNILRNYWYQFEITKDREVKVQVVPYAEVDLRPGFGLEVDTDRYIPITIDENGVTKVIYYNVKTGVYYDTDKVTPIANPFPGLDPITGRGIFNDADFNLLYYYDYDKGLYYAPDGLTVLENPYSSKCYDNVTGLTEVLIKDTDKRFYWYSATQRKFYAPTNKDHEVKYSLVEQDDGGIIGAFIELMDEKNGIDVFWDIDAQIYYSSKDKTTIIEDPFN